MIKKLSLLFLAFFSAQALKTTLSQSKLDKNQKTSFSIKFEPSPHESVYAESITLSSSTPDIILDNWQIQQQPTEQFDEQYKKTKQVFRTPFEITGTATKQNKNSEGSIALSYLTNQMSAPAFKFFNLSSKSIAVDSAHSSAAQSLTQQNDIDQKEPSANKKVIAEKDSEPLTCPAPHQKKLALSDYIQSLIAKNSSLWLRLLLIFLLGIIMSLTPCIYPMIPITVGLLQSQARKSVWYNFALATSYTIGIASMFAILGLTAAATGSLFGKLMSKPIVIILVVMILFYFALSMFGLYEIKLPRFLMQRKTQLKPSGSLFSAFIFGFVSGTIASPCLTPGLAFLLTFVAHMGNHLVGFFYMFTFGIGMSIPLLLIGTFSTSLKFIPKTGTWMLEVKKVFGILLLALCFYYLSNILSLTFLIWLIATSLLILGIYYLLTFNKQLDRFTRISRFIIAISGLVGSGALYFAAIQHTMHPAIPQQLVYWRSTYQEALQEAQRRQNKILFVDFGAPYCSICKAIDRCIFNEPFIASLINELVPVKIDAVNSPEYAQLEKKFKIMGVPTILAIDPTNETVINRWGAELYTMSKQEITSLIGELSKK